MFFFKMDRKNDWMQVFTKNQRQINSDIYTSGHPHIMDQFLDHLISKKIPTVINLESEDISHELEKAKLEAREIMDQAEKQANKKGILIINEAQSEAKEILKRNEKKIAKEKELMINEAQKDIKEVAIQLTQKIIKNDDKYRTPE